MKTLKSLTYFSTQLLTSSKLTSTHFLSPLLRLFCLVRFNWKIVSIQFKLVLFRPKTWDGLEKKLEKLFFWNFFFFWRSKEREWNSIEKFFDFYICEIEIGLQYKIRYNTKIISFLFLSEFETFWKTLVLVLPCYLRKFVSNQYWMEMSFS
jgi:hypothetical protein